MKLSKFCPKIDNLINMITVTKKLQRQQEEFDIDQAQVQEIFNDYGDDDDNNEEVRKDTIDAGNEQVLPFDEALRAAIVACSSGASFDKSIDLSEMISVSDEGAIYPTVNV